MTTNPELLGAAAGRHLHALAHNRDPRRVRTGRRRRSMGAQRALGRRPKSSEEVYATLTALADRLGRRLRAAGRVCRTVTLRLRFDDFSRATRSQTLPEPTAHTQRILSAAAELLAVLLRAAIDQDVDRLPSEPCATSGGRPASDGQHAAVAVRLHGQKDLLDVRQPAYPVPYILFLVGRLIRRRLRLARRTGQKPRENLISVAVDRQRDPSR